MGVYQLGQIQVCSPLAGFRFNQMGAVIMIRSKQHDSQSLSARDLERFAARK